MNKLVLALILMVCATFSGTFAMGFNGDVSVSEPSQFFVDVGSGESTMITEKSMLIKNTATLNTHAKSYTVFIGGVKFAEGTGGYVANMSGLKRLSG